MRDYHIKFLIMTETSYRVWRLPLSVQYAAHSANYRYQTRRIKLHKWITTRTQAYRKWWSYRWAIHVDKPIRNAQKCLHLLCGFVERMHARTHACFYLRVMLYECGSNAVSNWTKCVMSVFMNRCRVAPREWSDVMGVYGCVCVCECHRGFTVARSSIRNTFGWIDRHLNLIVMTFRLPLLWIVVKWELMWCGYIWSEWCGTSERLDVMS